MSVFYKLKLEEYLCPGQLMQREFKFKDKEEANQKITEIRTELIKNKREYKITLYKIKVTKELVFEESMIN